MAGVIDSAADALRAKLGIESRAGSPPAGGVTASPGTGATAPEPVPPTPSEGVIGRVEFERVMALKDSAIASLRSERDALAKQVRVPEVSPQSPATGALDVSSPEFVRAVHKAVESALGPVYQTAARTIEREEKVALEVEFNEGKGFRKGLVTDYLALAQDKRRENPSLSLAEAFRLVVKPEDMRGTATVPPSGMTRPPVGVEGGPSGTPGVAGHQPPAPDKPDSRKLMQASQVEALRGNMTESRRLVNAAIKVKALELLPA